MRAPSVEYTVAISRPMMPPPITSILPGTWRSSSAPVESTMRGSLGMKGRCTAAEPAAMMQFLNFTTFFAPVLSWLAPVVSSTSRWLRVEEAAVAADDVDLARLGHAREAAGELADHAVLVLRSASMSTLGLAKTMPALSTCSASSITAATCSSALEGMQPTFRHTPPSVA